MNSKRAGIYARRGYLYIRAKLQTDVGIWLERGPCSRLASGSPVDEIGTAVLNALSRSGTIIPHPTEWKSYDLDNPILQEAGIKRWSTFRKKAFCVAVGVEQGEMIVSSTTNEGSEGFAYLDNDILLPATSTVAEVGEAINSALKRCQ